MAAGTPVSIHEIIYPLLQGQDSVEVRADVELGGTDQPFTAGRPHLQSDAAAPQVCITTPLPGPTAGRRCRRVACRLAFTADDMSGRILLPDALMVQHAGLDRALAAAETARRSSSGSPRPTRARRRAAESSPRRSTRRRRRRPRQRFDRVFRDKVEGEALVVDPAADAPTGKL